MKKRVICFDLGDVLVHLRFERCLQELCALSGMDLAQAGDAARLFMGERGLYYNAGKMTPRDYLLELAKQFGIAPARCDEIQAAWCSIFDLWPEMMALAQDCLDAGHEVWLLSNTDPLHFELLRPQMPVLSQMHGLHLSYEIGCVKPDPQFYLHFLQRTGYAPQDCLFLDDREENVAAARAVGIDAHLFVGDVAAARSVCLG